MPHVLSTGFHYYWLSYNIHKSKQTGLPEQIYIFRWKKHYSEIFVTVQFHVLYKEYSHNWTRMARYIFIIDNRETPRTLNNSVTPLSGFWPEVTLQRWHPVKIITTILCRNKTKGSSGKSLFLNWRMKVHLQRGLDVGRRVITELASHRVLNRETPKRANW